MYCNFSSKGHISSLALLDNFQWSNLKKMESILLDAARDRKMQVDLEWKLSFSTWDY